MKAPFKRLPKLFNLSLSKSMKQLCGLNKHAHFELSTLNNKKADDSKESVSFKFQYLSDGKEVPITTSLGKSILEAARENRIEMKNNCNCKLACNACHIILESDIFDSIPHSEEQEERLLDQAYGLSHTSRLACQILLTKQFQDTIILIPDEKKITNNKALAESHLGRP
jgi:ferredoxin